LTINDIERKLGISERGIREHIKNLVEKGFIKRKVMEGDRLKYAYSAIPIKEGWNKVKYEIEGIVEEIDKVFSKLKNRLNRSQFIEFYDSLFEF